MYKLVKTKKTCKRCQTDNPMIRVLAADQKHAGAFTFMDITNPEEEMDLILQLAQRYPFVTPKTNGHGWGCFCLGCHVQLPQWDFDDLQGHPINPLLLSNWSTAGPHLVARQSEEQLGFLEAL